MTPARPAPPEGGELGAVYAPGPSQPRGGWCSQCGHSLRARACGPTHAIMFSRSKLRREADIQDAVLPVFRAYGIIAYPMNREKAGGAKGARHVGIPGLPDIGGTLPNGRSFYCEVKKPGEKPTPDQRFTMRRLALSHAFVCLVHSVDEAAQAAKEARRQSLTPSGRDGQATP